MLHWFNMLRFPLLNGIYLPFKIYKKSGIKIKRGASIYFKGRLTLGNADKERAVVSKLPINIFFGKCSTIILGHSITIGPGVNIIIKDNAKLAIGDGTYFTSDMHIEVVNSLVIGNNCAISWGVTIIDDDHHHLLLDNTSPSQLKEVVIGNHVWIGCNVTVLKNTSIGNNCIVAAGSIVKGIFPDNVLIAGNPAKIVKSVVNWE